MFRVGKVWYVKYFISGKRYRKSLKTTSTQRARKMVVGIEAAINEGRNPDHLQDIEVERFTTAFLADIATRRRPHTIKTLRHEWKTFTKWAQPIRLSDVNQDTIRAYLRHMEKEEYAKSTMRSSLLALSSIFRTAIQDMHVLEGVNPCKGIPLPEAEEAIPRFLDQAEIAAILEAATAHSTDMLLLMAMGIYTGMRKGELLAARWSWVDLEGQGSVLVQSQGRFKTKSGKVRQIPLNGKLRAILEPHRGDPGAFILFPDMPEKKSTTANRCDFTEAFHTVCRRAGIEGVTPHKLRHTFASQLVINGVSIYKVSQWLGHRSIKTTAIYSHLAPGDADIEKL